MTERGFKGVWIPREIWLHPGLTLQEKVLLVEIDSLDNDDGCFANNKHFSEFLNISPRRVQELLGSLKEKGYISVSFLYRGETKEIGNRVLRVLSPPYPRLVLPAEQVVQETAPGGEENFAGVVKETAPGGEESRAAYIRMSNTKGENQESITPLTPRRRAPTGKLPGEDDSSTFGNGALGLGAKGGGGSGLEGFAEFWAAYPRKKSKATAERAWAKIRPGKELQAEILAALEQAKQSREWQKEDGQYIPYPASWLNARGWEDELEPPGLWGEADSFAFGDCATFSQIAEQISRKRGETE